MREELERNGCLRVKSQFNDSADDLLQSNAELLIIKVGVAHDSVSPNHFREVKMKANFLIPT